jgi:PST family polysaccharide transporter
MGAIRTKLIGNFMSLSFQQGIAIIFPLLIFPYLLRVLGLSGFGVFTLIQTGIMYFDLLIAFGFNLTATQRIAKTYGNSNEQKSIITAVYYIKMLLFIASLLGILACSLFIPYLQQNIILILFASLYLLGNLLFPDWYFQGTQDMKICTLITLVSKVISFVLIVVLVKQQQDIGKAIFSLSAGNIVAGIVGFALLHNKVRWSFSLPDKAYVKALFTESSYVFVSIVLAPFYSSVNIFILQFFSTPLIVGSYSIAQKIFGAASMLITVANNTFFPHLTTLYTTSVMEYKKNIQKLLLTFSAAFLLFAVIQFSAAPFIITLLAGKNATEDLSYAILILRITSIALFFSPFVSFFFQQMIIQHQQKASVTNIVIAVVVNLITAAILSYYYAGIGMAVNICLITILIGFLNGRSVYKKLNYL